MQGLCFKSLFLEFNNAWVPLVKKRLFAPALVQT